MPYQKKSGFTLVELSIVLVIIGLIVGGVLVGRDLIKAAEIRAQVSQIEKYNTAVNTFKLKYGYLPGDIPEPAASGFGFAARGVIPGEGDGNGVIEGVGNVTGYNAGIFQNIGELGVFWVDLSRAGMIDGSFRTAQTAVQTYNSVGGQEITLSTTPNVGDFMPKAKIGGGNYVYVWSGGWGQTIWPTPQSNGVNYFGISTVYWIDTWYVESNRGLTVSDAYNIDKKIDDGLPQTGSVIAQYLDQGSLVKWANNVTASLPYTSATAASSTSCYDNGNTGGAVQQYSLSQNSGNNVNCALSLRFQ